MNLFISDNFIDTVGQRVNVLQVIRQIAEDDELVHSEVMGALSDVLDYVSVSTLEDAINQGEVEDVTLADDTLYVGGETLKALFEELFPDDHTDVVAALVNSISASTAPSLRLNHNCTPVVDPVQEEQLNFAAVPAIEPTPFQGDSEATQVLQPEVATLNSEAILGELLVDGRAITVRLVAGKNGVLFSVQSLYHVVYNLQHDPDYLRQVLVEYRTSIDPEDILLSNNSVYLTVYGLAKLHSRLCHIIEWQPLVAKIVNQFTLNPYENASFDLLGNQVG